MNGLFFFFPLAGDHGITPFEVSISRSEWTQRRSLFYDNGHLVCHYPLQTHGETKKKTSMVKHQKHGTPEAEEEHIVAHK